MSSSRRIILAGKSRVVHQMTFNYFVMSQRVLPSD